MYMFLSRIIPVLYLLSWLPIFLGGGQFKVLVLTKAALHHSLPYKPACRLSSSLRSCCISHILQWFGFGEWHPGYGIPSPGKLDWSHHLQFLGLAFIICLLYVNKQPLNRNRADYLYLECSSNE